MSIQLKTLIIELLAVIALLLSVSVAAPAGESCEIGYDFTGNGIDDGCEVAAGATDCNGNNVPDEWELTNPPVKYQLDDGNLDEWGYYFFPLQFVLENVVSWNHYKVQPNGEVITAIEAGLGMAPGATVQFIVWGDPNGNALNDDGDIRAISDIYLIDDLLIEASEVDNIIQIPIPPTYVGSVGDSFFVGMNVWPSPFLGFVFSAEDNSKSMERSWYAVNGIIESPASSENVIQHSGNMAIRAITPGGTDLNGNGLLDTCEDCDANGIADDLDVLADPEIDCDDDGIPDVCQPRGNWFEIRTPVFDFPPLQHTWHNVPPPATPFDVQVGLRFVADAAPPIAVDLDGTEAFLSGVGAGFCLLQHHIDFLPADTFASLVADGSLTATITTNTPPFPSECLTGSAMYFYIRYHAAIPGDLNGNGLLDACEPPPPPPGPDISGNGHIDMQDVVLLLEDWGCSTSPCPPWCDADLNADCTVDVFDLLVLLASWE